MNTQTHATKREAGRRPTLSLHELIRVGIAAIVSMLVVVLAFMVAIRWGNDHPYVLAGCVALITITFAAWSITAFVGGGIFFSEVTAQERERGADTILRGQESDDKRDVEMIQAMGKLMPIMMRQMVSEMQLPAQQQEWPQIEDGDSIDAEFFDVQE